jgi:hypothetical protein
MLRACCFSMTVALLCLASARADAPELGANAALKYWQAFAALPKQTDAEINELVAQWRTMPLDARAKELLAQSAYSLQMMHRGAAVAKCNWGIGYEDGVNTRISQAPAARVLSALACLRARQRFEEGRKPEAVDDLVAALTLARHSSQGGGIITVLFSYAVERGPLDLLARYLPKLDAQTIKDVKTRLAALPTAETPAGAMYFEEHSFLDWFIRAVREAKDKESLVAILGLVSQGAEPAGGKGLEAAERGRAFLEACGGTAEGVIKFAEQIRPCYTMLAKSLDLPLDEFEKEWKAEAKRRMGNPVFKEGFPAIGKVRRTQARMDVRRALFSAALAVQSEGRDALKSHPDPVIGGPFEYVAFEGGFELRSKLTGQDDKPITLTVGVREK